MTTDPAARPSLDKARLAADPRLVPGWHVEVHDELGSTNARAGQSAADGAAEGLVVVTEHQTSGRGRLDRTWETPARTALTFSLVLRPTAPTRSWPWLPLLAGYAVDKTLKARGYASGVKWPNDVLIGDRKVAGILVERIDTPGGPVAVLGIGLNTAMPAGDLPVPEATSLLVEGGEAPDRTDLLLEVLSSISEAYDAWQAGGDQAGLRLAESYAGACLTIGRDVRVDLPGGGVLEGRAETIDPAGRLVVQTADAREAVGAGDVRHVRTTDG